MREEQLAWRAALLTSSRLRFLYTRRGAMVCETPPRLRSLLVSRRGGFLEDPFFRDAWGDYNNAVRRIVDRFNHGGMFAPRDRLRDSHYHSMYRTLRSARINYAAQSARFKDEGSVYKLVMDVREFVGGDLTVRTAGGTLSVRGRLETGAANDADSGSGSSRASSARTLHRRFNLPPDADGEKVESMLSRDAVLTVTIPKRTDVRVIPVRLEGGEGGGRSGTKRPSASHPDLGPSPSKRPQDQAHTQDCTATGRGALPVDERGERSRDSERHIKREREEAQTAQERASKRGSDIRMRGAGNKDQGDVRRKSYEDEDTAEGDKENVNGNRRRNRDTADEEAERRSRRSSKYEEAKEINIPIRLERSADPNSIVQPTKGVVTTPQSEDDADPSPVIRQGTDQVPNPPKARDKMENGTSNTFAKARDVSTPKDIPKVHVISEKSNIKPSKDEGGWTYSDLYQINSPADAKENKTHINTTKPMGSQEKESHKKVSSGVKSAAAKTQDVPEVRVPPGGPLAAAADRKQGNNLSHNKGETKYRVQCQDENTKKDVKDKNTDVAQEGSAGGKDYLRNTSQESGSPEGRSKSPFGGREVKVEKKQSDMEGDMFKDCWQNFSSTLQEVLARLQELSAELGHNKPQSKPSSPPTDVLTESGQQTPESQRSQQATSTEVSSQNSPKEEINKQQSPVSFEGSQSLAGETGTTVGVGGGPPTTSPPVYADERSATRSEPSGKGAKYASTRPDTHVQRKSNESTRSDGLKPRTQQVSESSVPGKVCGVPLQGSGGGGCGARARDNTRPVSLVLPDRAQDDTGKQHKPMNSDQEGNSDSLSTQISKPQTNGAAVAPVPRPRPTSLNISHEGPLLKNLRKSSPVDALKDKFLSEMTPTSESSSATDVHYIPVEVEARKTVPTTGIVAEDTASRGSHTAAQAPLHERRGKGVDNLVIVDDDQCSTDSSQVSTSASESNSVATSSCSSESCADKKPEWPVPSQSAQLEGKPTAGNSSLLNLGPDPLQQHSSSGGGGADPLQQHSSSGGGGADPLQQHSSSGGSGGDSGSGSDDTSSGSGTGGSHTQPRPLLPSTSSSDSDPDVDEIISQAERVIEETRRLSATTTNDLPLENDLGEDKAGSVRKAIVKDSTKPSGFNLAPNIDTRSSPESNFVETHEDEDNEEQSETSDEAEVVVKGCLSIPLPAARPRPPRHTPRSEHTPIVTAPTHAAPPSTPNDSLLIEAVDDTDDVTGCDEVRPTIVTSPEIQSSDVMGCARESGRGGDSEAPPTPREAPPRTLTHQAQPTLTQRRPSSRERMGGLFSRGRTEDSTSHPSPASSSGSSKPAPPSPQTPSTPTLTPRLRQRSCTPQEEPPPYVRQKAEPTKRYSGFSHVQSDNVRKMRDVWSSKDSPPQRQQQPWRGARVSTTPPPSPRRARDSPTSTFSRVTPTRETFSGSPTKTNNFYNSTFSSRSRSSSSPRRGSTSEGTEGVAPSARDGSRNTSASAKSTRPLADNNSRGGSPGPRASAARKASRTQKASPTRRAASDRHSPPPASPSEPPPASPFHHKLFRRLRDASLQPDSETICFTEEEERYKLVMDVEEYVPGEIEVLQDEKHLTVKGRVETTQRGNTTTRTFHRNFHIPNNTREEDIDSALSRDGILTVYVPKKKERVIKIELTD